ncbi:MAG: hypothetical protein AAGK23_08400 [Pseudomonadota bacterium]
MKSILILVSFLALTACGFRPVHTSTGLSGASASQISIPEIPGRGGHALRKALLAEFATGLPGVDSATLTITLDESLARLSIRPDETAARSDALAIGRYVLDTGEDAIAGEARAEASFNVPVSAFGDITSQTDASERTMTILAQRIADDLRLKLAERE